MYDLIVVGGGPAGLTAAIYALRKRLNVLLISKDLGGKTNFRLGLPWVEDYTVIRGLETENKFKGELKYLDSPRHMEPVEKISRNADGIFSVVTKGGGELQTKAVIVATGARQQRLNVPGEKDYIMRGLCYSALSYAPLFIDKETVVIGDGDLAYRAAAELATVSKHVTLVRSNKDGIKTPMAQKVNAAKNVTLMEGCQVVEVKGDEFARGVVVKDAAGKTSELMAEGTFIEMALMPNTQMVAGLVDMDEQNRIMVDCACRTSIPGLFAAGDATNGYTEQVLIAVGEGAKAALSAYEYLLQL
jgi:NADH-dependent peroxiredoxin subunit F